MRLKIRNANLEYIRPNTVGIEINHHVDTMIHMKLLLEPVTIGSKRIEDCLFNPLLF